MQTRRPLMTSSSSEQPARRRTSATLFLYVGDTASCRRPSNCVLNQPSVFVGGGFERRKRPRRSPALVNSVLDEENVFDLQLEAPEYYEFGPRWAKRRPDRRDRLRRSDAGDGGVFDHPLPRHGPCARVRLHHVRAADDPVPLADRNGRPQHGGRARDPGTATLLCGFDWYAFKNIADEFATGKTLTASIKGGYKKSLALTIDVHVVLFVAALILYFAATGAVLYMATILLFGTAPLCGLLFGRDPFLLLCAPRAAEEKIAFCNFKREETEDA